MGCYRLHLLDVPSILSVSFHEHSVTQITTPLKSSKIEEIVQEWYAEFVKVDQRMLFELVTAANFMDIKALLDITCLAVSVLIKVSTLQMRVRLYSTRFGSNRCARVKRRRKYEPYSTLGRTLRTRTKRRQRTRLLRGKRAENIEDGRNKYTRCVWLGPF